MKRVAIMKKLTIRIDDDLWRELKQHALDNDTSQTALVKRYINDGIDKDKMKVKA